MTKKVNRKNINVISTKKESADIIAELEDRIVKMKEDKETKCKAAKEQLVNMLDVTVDKYKTATGTAEALRVLRFVAPDEKLASMEAANELAYELANETQKMREKADGLEYANMDQLCDGFYEKEFVIRNSDSEIAGIRNLAFEMMRIDLCRNVGDAAEDMVSFVKRVQEEIDATGEELKKRREEEEREEK